MSRNHITKPIPYKAEIALEYPEKLYIGVRVLAPYAA
jgi:hypothetical protein